MENTMENTMGKAMNIQENVVSMMNSQLESLETELYDAYASLGKAALDRSRGNEMDSSIYYKRQDFCSICEEKVSLMKKLIRNASLLPSVEMPAFSNI